MFWLLRPPGPLVGPEPASATGSTPVGDRSDAAPYSPSAAPQRHTVELHDASSTRVGEALLLRRAEPGSVVAFLPLARLPMRGGLTDDQGQDVAVEVLALSDAYGFVLLTGLAPQGYFPLRPRRSPILNGTELTVANDDERRQVVGRAPGNPNELILDVPCADGTVFVDADGDVAALGLGGRSALAVTPVWSWLDAQTPTQSLSQAQGGLRARDPRGLLEDTAREINQATSPEATRAALDRLEIGFALARGADLVGAFDKALRDGHRVLAQRLATTLDARGAFDHIKTCLLRFAADDDVLADAVVLAAGAGEYHAAADLWLELRSRDAVRAQDHASGLADALTLAAQERSVRAPREAVEILARGVDLFPDRAALRMAYASQLLQTGDGESALWQARIAAERDPGLTSRLEAIAARTSTKGTAVEIPIDPASHIVRAQCTVAGRDLELMVDTGASITVLPSAFAAIGTRTGRRVRIQTASGAVEGELVRFADVRIGTITVRHITAAAIDLPGSLAGKGLLGMNVLKRLNMRLDSERGVLVLQR